MGTFVVLALAALAWISSTSARITYIEARYPLTGNRSEPGAPWPLPKEWLPTAEALTLIGKEFEFTSNMPECDILPDAFKRYKKYIFISPQITEPAKDVGKITELVVSVTNNSCGYPQPEEDESYELDVKAGVSTLTAEKVWGALRGLETFSQLVYIVEEAKKETAYLINATKIIDEPAYKYRGILLDTARHFQPMKVLKQNLDAMSMNKFNVFHWHLVDDQSFPFESKLYPNLTEFGAYSPKHIFTQNDMKEIIEFARLRGIRVIPEIDTPGHTKGFGQAFPDLITPCYGDGENPYTANYTEHSESEMLNPIQNYTYDFFKEFFAEVKTIFPDPYIHLGMDEVYYGCWKSNPNIAQFMENNGMVNISEVEGYYVERTLRNVKDIGYSYMTWQDPVDNGVKMDPDVVIQVWKDTSLDEKLGSWFDYIKAIAKEKYKMIVSACWYLNYISYGMDWEKYYQCDPRGFEGTDEEKELVIGGEACMWGEYVDATNLIPRLWPRASAVGERLWSPSEILNVDDAKYRLDEQRCRMLRRGIPTQPVLNGVCGEYEWDIDAKYPPESTDEGHTPASTCPTPEPCPVDCGSKTTIIPEYERTTYTNMYTNTPCDCPISPTCGDGGGAAAITLSFTAIILSVSSRFF